jgi:hypothetical protein
MGVTCRPPARRDRNLGVTSWQQYSSGRIAIFQETAPTRNPLKSCARPLVSQIRVDASVARIPNHG